MATSIIGQPRAFEFREVDALAEAARAWDLEFTQLEQGGFRGSLAQAVAADLNVAWARFEARLEQRGSTPPGMVTFAVPATPDFRTYWRGQEVSAAQLMRFPRSRELHSISDVGFEVLTLSVSESVLARTAEELRLQDAGQEVTAVSESMMNEVREVALRALQDPDSSASEVCAALLRAVATPGSGRGPKQRAARHSALNRALGFADANEHRALTVRDLCLAAECSERTVRRAFQERFGVSPKTYLRSRRLAGVRREFLRSASTAEKIHEVAGRWGFWHMGQFAQDYRRQFGELPSATLARATH